MRYLITGGCGFLGSNVSAELIRRNEPIWVFDNLSRFGATKNLEHLQSAGDMTFVHGDIRCSEDVEQAVKQSQPDVIFHFAGQVAMTRSVASPKTDFEVNALGTLHLLEAVRRHALDCAVLYSSTNKVYGDLETLTYVEGETRYTAPDYPNGFAEDLPLAFRTPYGCSKGAADQYLVDYAHIYGLKTCVLRHSSIYGSMQFPTFDQGWVGWFSLKLLEQAQDSAAPRFTISGDGKQVRDLLHANDAVELYLSAAARIEQVSGQAFNIGGGIANSFSILELIQFLEDLLQVKARLEHIEVRQSDQKIFVADHGKASRALDWKPSVSSAAGVELLVDWLRSGKMA